MSALIALTENETWRLEQYEDYDYKEVVMTTLAFPNENKPKVVCKESLDPELAAAIEAAEGIVATAKTEAYAPATVRRDGLLIRLARPLVAFYDFLSGPPMSQAGRARNTLAEDERARATFNLMWYSRGVFGTELIQKGGLRVTEYTHSRTGDPSK